MSSNAKFSLTGFSTKRARCGVRIIAAEGPLCPMRYERSRPKAPLCPSCAQTMRLARITSRSFIILNAELVACRTSRQSDEGRVSKAMSEPLLGESTAQDDQRVVRPSVSSGYFWINPYRSGSDRASEGLAKRSHRCPSHLDNSSCSFWVALGRNISSIVAYCRPRRRDCQCVADG